MEYTEIHFRISALTPQTFSFARCADYIAQLVKIYGKAQDLHFGGIEEGSVNIVVKTTREEAENIKNRIASNDPQIEQAFNAMDALLAADKSEGRISSRGEVIKIFVGRKNKPVVIRQNVVIDGVIIKIGGKSDEIIPVLVRDTNGKEINCKIKGKEEAKKLALHYLRETLRIAGTGKMTRKGGEWTTDDVTIQRYEILDEDTPADLFARLRAMKNNKWRDFDDPIAEWRELRGA